MRVTTIDDNITLLKVRFELFDELVDGIASFDEEDDLTRLLEFSAEFFDGVSALNIRACRDGARVKLMEREGNWIFVPWASFARKWSTLDTVRL